MSRDEDDLKRNSHYQYLMRILLVPVPFYLLISILHHLLLSGCSRRYFLRIISKSLQSDSRSIICFSVHIYICKYSNNNWHYWVGGNWIFQSNGKATYRGMAFAQQRVDRSFVRRDDSLVQDFIRITRSVAKLRLNWICNSPSNTRFGVVESRVDRQRQWIMHSG